MAFITLLVFFSGCQQEGNSVVEKHLKKAHTYALGNYNSAATIELKKALEASPGNIKSLLLLDKVTSDSNNAEVMLPYLQKAYKHGVRDYKILYKLAETYFDQKQYKKALSLTRSQAKNITDPNKLMDLKFLEAKIHIGLEEFDIANKFYTHLLRTKKYKSKAQLGLSQVTLAKIRSKISYHPAYINLRLVGSQYLLKPTIRMEHVYIDEDLLAELHTREKSLNLLLKEYPDNLLVNLAMAETLYFIGNFSLSSKFANHSLSIDKKNRQALFLLAKANIRLDYYQAAIRNLKQLLAINSDDLEASNTLGALYIHRRDIESAEILLEDYVKKGVEDEDLYLNMGLLELLNKDIKKARIYLEFTTKLFPESAYAHAQLGTIYLNEKKIQQALDEFVAAHDNDTENLEIGLGLIQTNLISGRVKNALRLSRSLAGQHENSAVPIHVLGMIYYLQNDTERAISEYQEALSVDPKYYLSRIEISKFLLRQNKIAKAEAFLKEGLSLESKQINLSTELARLEAYEGNYKQAVERLEKISLHNPDSILAVVSLGKLYLQVGDVNKAIKIKKTTDKIEHKSIDTILFLANLYERLDNTTGLVEMYQQAYELSPSNPEYQLLLSKAYTKQGNYELANNLLKNLLSLFGDQYLPALAGLAELNLKQNKFNSTKNILKQMLQIDPESNTTLLLYADLQAKMDKFNRAVKVYSKLVKKDHKPELIKKLSYSLLGDGKEKTASLLLKKWIKVFPESLDISLAYIDFYKKTDNIKLAIKESNRFLKQQPDNILILNELASIYSKTDKNKAWDYAKTAYSISQDSPAVLSTYGRMCISKGWYKEGLNVLGEMNKAAPNVPSYQYYYAYGLNQSGLNQSANNQLAEKLLKSSLQSKSPFREREQAKQLLSEL